MDIVPDLKSELLVVSIAGRPAKANDRPAEILDRSAVPGVDTMP